MPVQTWSGYPPFLEFLDIRPVLFELDSNFVKFVPERIFERINRRSAFRHIWLKADRR